MQLLFIHQGQPLESSKLLTSIEPHHLPLETRATRASAARHQAISRCLPLGRHPRPSRPDRTTRYEFQTVRAHEQGALLAFHYLSHLGNAS